MAQEEIAKYRPATARSQDLVRGNMLYYYLDVQLLL